MILPQNNFGVLLEDLSYFLLFNNLHVQSILLALLVLLNALLQQDLVGLNHLIVLYYRFRQLSRGNLIFKLLMLLGSLLDLRQFLGMCTDTQVYLLFIALVLRTSWGLFLLAEFNLICCTDGKEGFRRFSHFLGVGVLVNHTISRSSLFRRNVLFLNYSWLHHLLSSLPKSRRNQVRCLVCINWVNLPQ